MDVSVVITCWNGKTLLEKNLPLVVKAANNPQNKIKEIIMVDDGSTDDSAEYINKIKDQSANWRTKIKIRLITHDKNYGYSKTCNTGMNNATGDLVAILNLDVVPDNNFLEYALPHFQDEKVFAVSFNEGKFGPGKIKWEKGFLEIKPSNISENTELADWANGGSSIFIKSVWEEIGGMDMIFLPFYFEDIDLGLRAKKRGYKCLWESRAKVVHQHEATINRDSFKVEYINAIKERNHLLLTWRSINSPFRFLSHIFYLLKRCILNPGYLKIVFSALIRSVKTIYS